MIRVAAIGLVLLVRAANTWVQQPSTAPGDTAALASILVMLRDTNTAAHDRAVSALRRDGAALTPALTTMLHRRDVRERYLAAVALVEIGPPALATI